MKGTTHVRKSDVENRFDVSISRIESDSELKIERYREETIFFFSIETY